MNTADQQSDASTGEVLDPPNIIFPTIGCLHWIRMVQISLVDFGLIIAPL